MSSNREVNTRILRLTLYLTTLVFVVMILASLLVNQGAWFSELGLDFVVYRATGTLIEKGEFGLIYEPLRQMAEQRALLEDLGASADVIQKHLFLPMVYPPGVAAIFLPLAWMPPTQSLALLLVFEVVVFVIAILLLFRGSKAEWSWQNLRVCLALPLVTNLIYLQLGPLLLLATALYFYLSTRSRPTLAGVALSLLVIKPHFLLFFALAVIVMRQFKELLGLSCGVAFVVAIGYFFGGVEIYQAYLKLINEFSAGIVSSGVAVQANLRALLSHFTTILNTTLLLSLVMLFAVVLFGTWVYLLVKLGQQAAGSDGIDARLILITVTWIVALTLSTHSHTHAAVPLVGLVMALQARGLVTARSVDIWTLLPYGYLALTLLPLPANFNSAWGLGVLIVNLFLFWKLAGLGAQRIAVVS